MDYKGFLQPFYNSTKSKSGLRGITSQGDIAKYFMEIVFGGVVPCEFIFSHDTYRKWFTGPNKPKVAYWKRINNIFNEKIFDEAAYKTELSSKINDAYMEAVAAEFGIHTEKLNGINKELFAEALTLQFKAIVVGKGFADDIVAATYNSRLTPNVYGEYIQKAVNQYNNMTLLGGEECSLDDGYVCNYIATSSGVFVRNKRGVIADATLEKLRTFDRRGVSNNILLVASGGMGKTLMLQHLFVDAANKYSETGLLPIFIELREFSFEHRDIFDMIVETVQSMDDSFTREDVHQLLAAGRCQLLLDGVDEIDPSDIKDFQRKLDLFLKRYQDNQVVMTSRACDSFSGIKRFLPLYLLPFDKTQSEELINKLVGDQPGAKERILDCINKGFINKDGAFVSNPMMLTFIIKRYPQLNTFYKNRFLFYKDAYDTIVVKHDKDKTAYERIYRSVNSTDEFTTVFGEFCGTTYRQGVFQFDTATFDKYFNELKSTELVENPRKLTPNNFRHDACATACMMYEEDLDIFYVDPGFQEYMFAKYYAQADPSETKAMGKALFNVETATFGKWTAFKMLYDHAQEKTEVCLFIPFLESLFKERTEKDAFRQFLVSGYQTLRYVTLDEEAVQKYKPPAGMMGEVKAINEPKTVLLSVIYKILKERDYARVLVKGENVQFPKLTKVAYTGELVNACFSGETGEKLLLRCNLQSEFEDASFEQTHDVSACIRDEAGKIVCFGHEYEIETAAFVNEEETYQSLLEALYDKDGVLRKLFDHVGDYYKQLVEKHKSNGLI